MKLIIQIPCYNEAETLEITLNELPPPLDISEQNSGHHKPIEGIDTIEYLIINDGSRDNTVEVAVNWAEKNGRILHVVNFKRNKGLAKGFVAGIDACLRLGADIIVNTDADNQYSGDDIAQLVRPIIENKADIVIGERPIATTAHFSPLKKKLQRLGSWVVQKASDTDIPDAPSGFRAYSRDAAMRLNVFNDYTYTLETIIQAGREKIAMTSVPIRTNGELRPSRDIFPRIPYPGGYYPRNHVIQPGDVRAQPQDEGVHAESDDAYQDENNEFFPSVFVCPRFENPRHGNEVIYDQPDAVAQHAGQQIMETEKVCQNKQGAEINGERKTRDNEISENLDEDIVRLFFHQFVYQIPHIDLTAGWPPVFSL